MKNSVFDNDLNSFNFTRAYAKGRRARTRAFRQLWKSAVSSIK